MKGLFQLSICVLLVLFGCDFQEQKKSMNVKAPAVEQLVSNINWQHIGNLPPASGYDESIGISGHFVGFIGDYLIVAGGTNFPDGHPYFNAAAKTFYSDIWVFDVSNQELSLVSKANLPFAAAYGATVVNEGRLYFVGGQNEKGELSTIIELELEEFTPRIRSISDLPFSWSQGGAAIYNQALYLFAGTQNGLVTNAVCRYSFDSGKCEFKSAPEKLPDVGRVQFPFIHQDNKFYMFGGINGKGDKGQKVLTNTHVYDFDKNDWQTLAKITDADADFSVSGGAAIPLSDDEILLLGGVNKAVFEDALFQFVHLEGQELKDYKASYFNKTTEEHHFSRRQLVYNMKLNTWRTLVKDVPFAGGAGPLSVAQKNGAIYWIGGEIKPVVRTPKVYQGRVMLD